MDLSILQNIEKKFERNEEDFSILQDIEKKLEKNCEERGDILQRILSNKTAGDQKDCDIETEITDVKNTFEELRRIQENFSVQVSKN